MAKEVKKENPSVAPAAAAAGLVQKCSASECAKKPKRANFCDEHFEWFKVGLINRKGERPRDFDQKYQNFMRKKAA